MANKGMDFAISQLTHFSLGDWSRTEYLYIQLQSELLFAVACLPAIPHHSISDISQYTGYCQYFATTDAATGNSAEEAGSGVAKGLRTFIDKRDKLSGFVMWALQQMSLEAIRNRSEWSFSSVQISPAMLQKYRQIRERLGFDTYMYGPKLWPELWSFLQDAARNQFPEFSGDATQAGPTQDVDIIGDVNIDIDSTPIVRPAPTNNLAATSDHGLVDEDEMPGAGTDADDVEDEKDVGDGAEDDVNSETTRPDPDDFAKETGKIRCTEYANETGERCKLHAKTMNEDRWSWKCHNHDPVRKQQILTDRLARNRAKKAKKA